MRSKTRVVRPRLSVSPRRPSPTSTAVRPIPTPNLDDVNEEYDVAVDSDDDVTVGERRYRHLDCSNSGGLDWLDGEACIQCNKRGEELLVCSEIGCPVAVHESCLRLKPKYDAGKFFCPYCWYKREVAKTRELREKAMLAKKALSEFIDSRVENVKEDCGRTVDDLNRRSFSGRTRYDQYSNTVDIDGEIEKELVEDEGDGNCDGNDRKLAESLQGRVALECHTGPAPAAVDDRERTSGIEPLVDSISKENVSGAHLSKPRDIEIMEVEQMQEHDDELVDDGPDEETLEDEEGAELLNAQAMEEQAATVPSEENQGMPVERVLLEEPETTVLSTREVAQKEPEMPDPAVDTTTVHQRRHTKLSDKKKATPHLDSESPRKSSPRPRASKQRAGNQNKVNSSKKSGQPEKFFEQRMYTNFAVNFANEKRKRVLWSSEEEEMLKMGVEKYSNTTNKNIPWRKILEYGHHVFDCTRTPDDLRSKWKNNMANGKRG